MSIVVKIVILHELASKFNIKINIILHYYSKSSFIDGKKKKLMMNPNHAFESFHSLENALKKFPLPFFSRFMARRPEKPKDYGSENFV